MRDETPEFIFIDKEPNCSPLREALKSDEWIVSRESKMRLLEVSKNATLYKRGKYYSD